MIKLLVLCLLATVVTMEEDLALNSKHDVGSSSSTDRSLLKPHSSLEPHSSPASHASPKLHSSLESHASPGPHASPEPHSSPESHASQEPHTTHSLASITCNCTSCTNLQCTAISSEYCATTTEENTFATDGHKSSGVNRTCWRNADLCNKKITITLTQEVYWRSYTSCCRDNYCNSPPLPVPSVDTTPGKLVCPSCFAFKHSGCSPRHMKCATSETKCIDVSGTVTKGSNTKEFVGKGCASSFAHMYKGTTLQFGNAIYHFRTITNATDGASQTSGSVPFIFLLSGFVGLLQVY